MRRHVADEVLGMIFSPPHDGGQLPRLNSLIDSFIKDAEKAGLSKRLWQKDASLWEDSTGSKEIIENSLVEGIMPLGWLNVAEKMREAIPDIERFTREVIGVRGAGGAGYKSIVLLGMGGSSLAPLVFSKIFAPSLGFPAFFVLDTTDPRAIKKTEAAIDPVNTLFIVSSKSGTTVETLSLFDYFYGRVSRHKASAVVDSYHGGVDPYHGGVDPHHGGGENFIAITDPGTPLEALSLKFKFRRVFLNPPDIGGRFSALSFVGLIPAALMGIDLNKVLLSAEKMMKLCAPGVKESTNPAVYLGCALAAFAALGRDKLTFLMPPDTGVFSLWLEQLIAESTGKEGKGIIPVVGEPLLEPQDYAADRVFIRTGQENYGTDGIFKRLEDLGHPIISIPWEDAFSIGGEFYRWEFAIAVCGVMLNVNPFSQPDVEEAKKKSRAVLEKTGKGDLPVPPPDVRGENFTLSFGLLTRKKLGKGSRPLQGFLRDFLGLLSIGSYASLLAYVDPDDKTAEEKFTSIRAFLTARRKVATQLGYGPRYLHSTGQLHKGGPAGKGVFMIFVSDDSKEHLPIPGKPYSFGSLKLSQAIGDAETLDSRDRPVAFFTLKGESLKDSLGEIESAIRAALA